MPVLFEIFFLHCKVPLIVSALRKVEESVRHAHPNVDAVAVAKVCDGNRNELTRHHKREITTGSVELTD